MEGSVVGANNDRKMQRRTSCFLHLVFLSAGGTSSCKRHIEMTTPLHYRGDTSRVLGVRGGFFAVVAAVL